MLYSVIGLFALFILSFFFYLDDILDFLVDWQKRKLDHQLKMARIKYHTDDKSDTDK